MRLVFATHNPGKIKEMHQLLAGLDVVIVSAQEAGVTEDVDEDQDTFVGNALKKARFVAKKTGDWAVADDSGVTIDALNGRPGVYSARWAGEGANNEELVAFTLRHMADIPEGKRNASFHCVAALVAPDGREWTFEGVVEGKILMAPVGAHKPKLPYDVIFQPKGEKETFSQMSDAKKNSLSHRGRAFAKLRMFLEEQTRNG